MNAPQDKTEEFSYLDDESLEARFDTCTSVEGLARVLLAIAHRKLRKYRHPPMRLGVLPATEEKEEIDLSSDVSWPTLAEETDLLVTDLGFLPNGHWPPIKVGGRATVWHDPKLCKEAYGLAYVTALRLAHENPRLSRMPDQDVSSRRGLLTLVKWCIENMQPNGPGPADGTPTGTVSSPQVEEAMPLPQDKTDRVVYLGRTSLSDVFGKRTTVEDLCSLIDLFVSGRLRLPDRCIVSPSNGYYADNVNHGIALDDPRLCEEAYFQARRIALGCKAKDPTLSLVPDPQDNPKHGLLDLQAWCARNMQAAHKTEDKPLAGSTTPAEGKPKKREVTPAEIRAWQSYKCVCSDSPSLTPVDGKMYTQEMYEAAMKSSSYVDDNGKQITKPGFDSWTRYLRGYMKKAPKQKDTRSDLRPEEIAGRDNTEDLASVTNRFQPRKGTRAD
jgi:hypothetical protein